MLRLSLLSIAFLWAGVLVAQDGSFAEVAKRARQNKSTGQTKRVYTNDEVGPPVDPLIAEALRFKNIVEDYFVRMDVERTTGGELSKIVNDLAALDSGKMARNVLGSKNLDVDFPNRREWETRLSKAKGSYVTALHGGSKAAEMYHELRDFFIAHPTISRTQGDEMKLETLRKANIDAASRAMNQAYELQRVIEEGLKRAEDWKLRP